MRLNRFTDVIVFIYFFTSLSQTSLSKNPVTVKIEIHHACDFLLAYFVAHAGLLYVFVAVVFENVNASKMYLEHFCK